MLEENTPHEGAETVKKVESFKTSRGSIYTYDDEGKTTRYKKATEKLQPKHDLTVFADLTEDEREQIELAIFSFGEPEEKVYVLEGKPKKHLEIRRDISEVKDPDNLFLVILEGGERYTLFKKATLTPTIGYTVYETRSYYDDDGQYWTSRHMGNKVVEINYEE